MLESIQKSVVIHFTPRLHHGPAWGAAAVLMLVCMTSCGMVRETATKQMDAHYPIVKGSGLEVVTGNGHVNVHVDPASPDIHIVATLMATGATHELAQANLAAVRTVFEQRTPELFHVEASYPTGTTDQFGCSFDITLPDCGASAIHTTNGSIRVEGLHDKIDLDTVNGPISVRNQKGPVKASTSNGSMVFDGVTGSINAETSNGRIEINGPAVSANATTSNGSVTCRFTTALREQVTLHTSNGDMTLSVAHGSAASIDARTTNGSVSVVGEGGSIRGSKTHRSILLGSDDAAGDKSACELVTTNGSITVEIRP